MDRYINEIMAVAVVGMLLVGCNKFLDKQPMGVESSATFFRNEDHAIKAVTAVYDATAWRYSQEISEWFLGDICSDDAEKGGENVADWAELQQLKEFRGNAGNSICFYRWSEFYQGVYRANLVIDNVPGIDMDEDLRARLVAEAKFLRGYFYFQLIKTFGGVPLITHPLDPDEYCQPRATMEECWAQIEKDLSDAADALPEKSAYAASDMGRATKGAANALLAKAYIYQSKWSDAEDRAFRVINSMEYDLEPSYADNFKLAHENGIESVYEIQHVEVPTSDYGDKNEGQETSIYQGSRDATYFTGWGFDCPTQDFVDEFELNDPRLKATVVFDKDIIYEGTAAQQKADNHMSPTTMLSRKYVLEYQGPQTPEKSNAPANWRVIRFADVLLFHAEAANELGNTTEALESLNRVRRRVSMSAVTTTDQEELREAIYHERRVELGLEGHRFFDLVRQGRAAEVLADNGFIEGKHEYFPIPQLEIDVCDKVEQNPY
ncbi:MAG: RagB/SusD family nutrient uptake outer membrane protein [Chitinispirillaceae bacterium]|nr:RagB/SusD family nutrient uptake outer membrane protein [Chitinispirillaceae bacterium]